MSKDVKQDKKDFHIFTEVKTMNTVFSVDDFSDALWSASASGAAAGMNRSQSEWALERFLEEFSGSGENSKAEKGGGNGNHNHRPSDSTPTVPIDSDEFRAFLKNKLEQACAAVALFRASAVKAEGLSTQAENQVLQSGSDVQGSSKAQEQGEPDAGSSAVSTAQKKSGTQVRKATSESSREDSDDGELEGDTETTENMDLADAKRARRMQLNRESAKRSRRRKQAHMNELEAQVGQLRVEHSTLLERLTDMNHKYDEAAADNRILKADIEMLRAKVKVAEETVKRVTEVNPVNPSRPNIPSIRMPFVSNSPLEASTASVPLQLNSNQLFHRLVPSIAAPMHHQRLDNSFAGNNLVTPIVNPQTVIGVKTINETSALQHKPGDMQNHIGPGVSPCVPMPCWEPGLSHATAKNKKQS